MRWVDLRWWEDGKIERKYLRWHHLTKNYYFHQMHPLFHHTFGGIFKNWHNTGPDEWRKLYTQLHDRIVSVRILLADWRPLLFCSNPCRMAEASVHTDHVDQTCNYLGFLCRYGIVDDRAPITEFELVILWSCTQNVPTHWNVVRRLLLLWSITNDIHLRP